MNSEIWKLEKLGLAGMQHSDFKPFLKYSLFPSLFWGLIFKPSFLVTTCALKGTTVLGSRSQCASFVESDSDKFFFIFRQSQSNSVWVLQDMRPMEQVAR